MKSGIYILMTFLMSGLMLSACEEDFLNTAPKDFSSPETFLVTERDAEILVNGIYRQLDLRSGVYERTYPHYYDVMTDNAFNRSPWEGATDFARGTVTAENSRVAWKWSQNYQGIARANSFLFSLTTSSLDLESEKIKRYIAEAKFLRAWFYHDLANFFGNVPLVLLSGDLENGQPSNTPKEEIIKQVLQDVNDAIPDLPLSYTDAADNGRVTKGAAMAFKARVLLYDKQWEAAAGAAKAVMDLGIYSLYPDYLGLFLEDNEEAVTATEAIFQLYFTPQIDASFFQQPLMEWWPSFLPTLQLAESYYMANGLPITDPASGYDPENPYMNRDPRLAMSIYYPGAPITIQFWGMIDQTFDNYMLAGSGFKPKKWVNNGKATDRNSGEGTNKLLIRYGEVLLMYAEARNEASGPDPTVYAAIDELRDRAGMTTLSAAMPGLDQDGMREVIRNERRVELVFEGFRINDIRRWRIGEEVMVNALGYNAELLKTGKYPGDGMGTTADWQYEPTVIDFRSFNPERDYLWPIPQGEINANPNIKQNPGYN